MASDLKRLCVDGYVYCVGVGVCACLRMGAHACIWTWMCVCVCVHVFTEAIPAKRVALGQRRATSHSNWTTDSAALFVTSLGLSRPFYRSAIKTSSTHETMWVIQIWLFLHSTLHFSQLPHSCNERTWFDFTKFEKGAQLSHHHSSTAVWTAVSSAECLHASLCRGHRWGSFWPSLPSASRQLSGTPATQVVNAT